MSTGPAASASGYLTALFRAGTLSNKSDSELIEQFIKARSEQDDSAELAFSTLLQRHGAMVLRVCRGVLADDHQAEDAFQATFLVLAARARSIRRQVSLASWLYGVALRVSRTEQSRAARRRRHERRAARTDSESTTMPTSDLETGPAIHEEIARLPERYRSAVVLCYLEGLTHEAAAERLGRPVGTVRSRLATARERLKARLMRRGFAPAVIPPFAPGDAFGAAVPASLEASTLRASIHVVIAKTAKAGVASAEAIALMEKTMTNMTIGRVFVAAGSALAAALFTIGVGVVAIAALSRGSDQSAISSPDLGEKAPASSNIESAGQVPGRGDELKPTAPPARPDLPRPAREPIMIDLRTVDAQGKPLPGVTTGMKVFYTPTRAPVLPGMHQGTTDEQGGALFSNVIVGPGEHAQRAEIWAFKPGRALARISLSLEEKVPNPVKLTLEDPVNRIIKVVGHDGLPIEGLTVAPNRLQIGGRGTASIPDQWLADLMRTTDENGAVAITSIPRAMNILTVNISGRGISQHSLPLPQPKANDRHLIKLGKPGRLVGMVKNESGAPVVDAL